MRQLIARGGIRTGAALLLIFPASAPNSSTAFDPLQAQYVPVLLTRAVSRRKLDQQRRAPPRSGSTPALMPNGRLPDGYRRGRQYRGRLSGSALGIRSWFEGASAKPLRSDHQGRPRAVAANPMSSAEPCVPLESRQFDSKQRAPRQRCSAQTGSASPPLFG